MAGLGRWMRVAACVAGALTLGMTMWSGATVRAADDDPPVYGGCNNSYCGCGTSCGCGSGCACGSDGVGEPLPENATGFASENVLLLSRLSLPELGTGLANGNDCWGYVSPSGREYAIMGVNNAAIFVEVTDPRAPQIIATIPHPSSLWADIKVYQDHAYVSNEAGGGIQVISMAQIDQGIVTLVRSVTLGGPLTRTHNLAVNVESGRLYLCGANSPTNGLVIFSLADPSNPQLIGQYSDTYVHDADVVTMAEGPLLGREIAFCFVGSRGVDIVDVTDASIPQRLSRTSYPGLQYSHQGWYDPERKLVFQNDELDERNGQVAVTTTRVFNVANLSAPSLIGTFTSGLPASDHNLYIRDGFVYEANYRTGLRIFDTRQSATSPTHVGFFDTYPGNDANGFNGAWSVYPFFPSGTVIVSDIEGGLFVLDATFALSGGPPLDLDFVGEPPVLVNVHSQPIRARVVAQNGGALAPGASPEFVYRIDGGAWERIPLSPVGGDEFQGTLPALPCLSEIEFYLAALSSGGIEITEPLNAPFATRFATVARGEDERTNDTLETASGWVVGAPGDTATTGIWTRVDPVGTGAQPEDDHTPDPGVMCFITGQGVPGANPGDDDVDNGATTLTSPSFNAAVGVGEAYIGYWRWYSNDLGTNPNQDHMPILISNDGGQTWTQLEDVTQNANAWVYKQWKVSDFVAPTNQVRLRFVARDDPPGSIVEAGVDDVRVFVLRCNVLGDTNGDDRVDFTDLNVVLSQFGQSGPGLQGDVNGDGSVNFEDLNTVLGAFGTVG